MTDTQVAIVGAGITGLALRRELAARGVDSLVLEARARPGGVIHSPRVEGRVLEMGPQRTRLVRPVERLVRELGLADRVITPPDDLPLYVFRDGALRRVPFTVPTFFSTSLLTWKGKLRMLLEPFTGSARPGETVEEYVTRKLGREAYEYLVAPLYGGIYGSDPGEMLVEYTLGEALQTVGFAGQSLVLTGARWMMSGDPAPPAASFKDGMRELTDAMFREAGDRVRLEAPVRGVRREGARGDDDRWRVLTGEGEVRARRVVLTCAADEASRILEEDLPEQAALLDRFNYNPLAIVHLVGDCDLYGYGYQMVHREGKASRGVTWNDSLFDRDGVYTVYLGGASRPEVVDWPDDEIGRVAREEFRDVTGHDTRVLRVGRTRMPAWDRSWTTREELDLPPGIRLCANYLSRAGIPGRLGTARKAAGELAKELNGEESVPDRRRRRVAGG